MAGRMLLNAGTLTVASFLATGLVIAHAFYIKQQFYPSVVYLTKSNPSMAVLYVQALVLVALFGKVMKVVFFGQLRAVESENLMERAWYAVTETCLAFTVFRDDFSPRFVGLFTLLLFLKCFHWLAEDRVDFMERSPVITLKFHARMMGLMAVLSSMDSYFVSHAYFTTLLRGASVQIVFGFEYAILMTIVFHVAIKYILHTIDLRNAHPWENKAVYLLYTELAIDFARVILYTVFMIVMIRLHTFPLFAIRPFYLTVRAFKKALNDVVMSRKAIYAMNHLFPDASLDDISSGDNVCIVCREEMTPGAKKLPCGHIFHTACLRSWFQRQQTCPTCRSDILSMAHVRPGAANQNRPAQAAAAQGAPGAQQPAPAAGDQAAATPGAAGGTTPQAQPGTLPRLNMPTPGMFGFTPPGFFPPMGAATPGTSTETPVNSPPFLPPFFPPFMPGGFGGASPPGGLGFNLPFPPPPNFSGLSDAEVQQMEGSERAAVESRIQALRNIQSLLDAAVVQLQQYTSILGTLAASPHFVSPPTGARPATEASSSTPERTKVPSSSSSGADAPSTSTVATPEKGPEEAAGPSIEAESPGTSSEKESPSESLIKRETSSGSIDEEAEKVRQRRLQHFQQKLSQSDNN